MIAALNPIAALNLERLLSARLRYVLTWTIRTMMTSTTCTLSCWSITFPCIATITRTCQFCKEIYVSYVITLQIGTLVVRITAKHRVSLIIKFHYNLDSTAICILQQCSLSHLASYILRLLDCNLNSLWLQFCSSTPW